MDETSLRLPSATRISADDARARSQATPTRSKSRGWRTAMGKSNNSEKSNIVNVGYRNPPEHSRFKAGKSGNPRGRPKGSLNVATVLGRILRERVIITENGKRKKVTKLEVMISQLIDKAAGDVKAAQLLLTLARSTEERDIQAHIPVPRLEEVDEKVVQGILKRFEIARRGTKKDETDT